MRGKKPFHGFVNPGYPTDMSLSNTLKATLSNKLNKKRALIKEQILHSEQDRQKYGQKTYHISVRSKISPQIMNLQRSVDVKKKVQICQLLRKDSDLTKQREKFAAIAQKAVDKGDQVVALDLNISSEEESEADNPDENKIDKAFKRLQRKKDNLERYTNKVQERIASQRKEEEAQAG